MIEDYTDGLSLDRTAIMGLEELAACCGMGVAELAELMDYDALQALDGDRVALTFSAHWLTPLRQVAKLRRDFDLDLFAVAIALGHLDRITQLERQVRALQALLPSTLQGAHHE